MSTVSTRGIPPCWRQGLRRARHVVVKRVLLVMGLLQFEPQERRKFV